MQWKPSRDAQGCMLLVTLIGAIHLKKDGAAWSVIKLSLLLFQNLLIFRSQRFIKRFEAYCFCEK